MTKTGREQLEELFPRQHSPAMPDKAKQWVDLWRNNAPPEVRNLPQRHSAAGGEYQFAKEFLGRHWRFDWCLPTVKVAVEIDGGVYGHPVTCDKCGHPVETHTTTGKRMRVYSASGRHTRGAGFDEDCEKDNAATMFGWRVFHFTPGMLRRDPWGCVQMVAGAVREALGGTPPGVVVLATEEEQ